MGYGRLKTLKQGYIKSGGDAIKPWLTLKLKFSIEGQESLIPAFFVKFS